MTYDFRKFYIINNEGIPTINPVPGVIASNGFSPSTQKTPSLLSIIMYFFVHKID